MPVPRFVAGSLAAKIAISLGALSLGGVAYAAETGSLPGPAQSAAHHVLGAVGVPDADEHASDKGGQSAQSHGGQQLNATSPVVVGLCRAFAAGEKDEHGKALDSTAFQTLATAAGGEDKIEAFCADVLANQSSGPTSGPSEVPGQSQPNPEPTPPEPSGSANPPTEPPSPTHPTGPPTDLPTPTNLGKP